MAAVHTQVQAYRHSRKYRSQAVGLAARHRYARLSSLECFVSLMWTGLNWVPVSSGKGSNRSSSSNTGQQRHTGGLPMPARRRPWWDSPISPGTHLQSIYTDIKTPVFQDRPCGARTVNFVNKLLHNKGIHIAISIKVIRELLEFLILKCSHLTTPATLLCKYAPA